MLLGGVLDDLGRQSPFARSFPLAIAWFEQPWMRVGLLLSTIVLFTVPVTWGMLWAWGAVSS